MKQKFRLIIFLAICLALIVMSLYATHKPELECDKCNYYAYKQKVQGYYTTMPLSGLK